MPTLENAQEGGRRLPGRLQEDAAADADRRRRMSEVCRRARRRLAGRLPGRHGRVLQDLVATCGRAIHGRGSSKAASQDTWKTAPVAWETCWDMRKWVDEGWSLRYIFNYALALHASYINNKSAPLPDGPRRAARDRAVPATAGLSARAEGTEAPGQRQGRATSWTLSMKWQNTGSAPCYRPYRLAYRLSNDTRQHEGHRRARSP